MIAVTAARDVDTVRGAVGLGVAQYLVKPFTFATFREKLERYAAFRARRSAGGEAEQEEIDAMLGELRTPSSALPLPKGLSKETLELVASTLKRRRSAARRRRGRRAAPGSRAASPPAATSSTWSPDDRPSSSSGTAARPPGAPVPLGRPIASTAVPASAPPT